AHYSVERYGERLARHASEPGWEAVVGFDGAEPVGYAYINTLQPDDRWWRRMTTPLPPGCTGQPTVALKEIMLRVPWRGTGTARRIHDELLAARPEEQVSLLVNPLAGDGKVKALYEAWGYQEISAQQPAPDGPVLTAMLRAIRERAQAAEGVSAPR
ncbi:GNAT family N-acetyltransferase, partial [Streptomyces sp. NPDC058418]|uniref:GNAT family N-acetyltransferase n=1 Tax=Streptomyces sp. NPDC058418 TaxID=3346488 RepID=UPI00366A48F3